MHPTLPADPPWRLARAVQAMTALLVAAAALAGFTAGWTVCTRWHRALRVDRDLHELDAHMNGDAVHYLERREDRRQAALRYLARLPQPRRVRVMSRYCRLLQREAAQT